MSLILACHTAATPAAAADDPPQVIFNPKVFADTGDVVHLEGTLTGDGIGWKNNRSALTCYHKTKECWAVHIDSDGMQVFSFGPPQLFTIRLWTTDRIKANSAGGCGKPPNEWVIDRTRESAELIEHNCSEAKTYHWTLESPPFWKQVKPLADNSKRGR